jgi:hypothetical protein
VALARQGGNGVTAGGFLKVGGGNAIAASGEVVGNAGSNALGGTGNQNETLSGCTHGGLFLSYAYCSCTHEVLNNGLKIDKTKTTAFHGYKAEENLARLRKT